MFMSAVFLLLGLYVYSQGILSCQWETEGSTVSLMMALPGGQCGAAR